MLAIREATCGQASYNIKAAQAKRQRDYNNRYSNLSLTSPIGFKDHLQNKGLLQHTTYSQTAYVNARIVQSKNCSLQYWKKRQSNGKNSSTVFYLRTELVSIFQQSTRHFSYFTIDIPFY